MAGPGSDPRSWTARAIVDDDEDAIRWEDGAGWFADVTITGGPLDGEGPIPCQVASVYGAPGFGSFCPVSRGQCVAVVIIEGDLNQIPIIVGCLFTEQSPAPTEVNGDAIDEEKMLADLVLVTDKGRDEQIGGRSRTKVEGEFILASEEKLTLGAEGASQSFVKGDQQKDAINSFLTSLTLWSTQVATGISSMTPPASQPDFLTAITQLKADLASALSSKIKGE